MTIIRRLVFLVLLAVVLTVIGFGPSCKDPNDFEPAEDTLANPPPAPQLLSPIDYYVRMPDAPTCRLTLEWEAVPAAEMYEIDFTSDSNGSWTVPYDTNCFTIRLEKEPGQYLLDHFTWKVRAGNTHWKYYTGWSETRHFEVRYQPPQPMLVHPPYDTTIVADSLPVMIDFDWAPVQDEQYYDFDLIIDSFPIEYRVTTHSFQCPIGDTGTYQWCVRAGSPLWQYPSEWSEQRILRITVVP